MEPGTEGGGLRTNVSYGLTGPMGGKLVSFVLETGNVGPCAPSQFFCERPVLFSL
jgi:hypothetical protein